MPRNHDIAELRRLDVAHHLPAQADWAEIEKLGGSRIITHAEGCYIHDGDGHRILDGMAGLWCVNVGYGREELVDAAAAQMRELPFYNTFFKTATPPTVTLAAKISSLTGNRLPHIFFNASGSEANDTVFRMVRHYWKLKGEPKRTIFISRWNAYHGSTVAGVSLGGMKAMHVQGDLPIPGVEHVRQPYAYGEGQGMTEEEFCDACVQAIEDRILEVGPENCAAFIGEPVQGAGGVIIPPKGYWPKVEAVVRKYGLLMVSDEVICGFGRTGEWFAADYFGFMPDVMTLAKGITSGYIPLGAAMFNDRVAGVLANQGGELAHGCTYSGHPVCTAVALENIRILQEEKIIETCKTDTAPYLAQRWAELGEHRLVGEARIAGMVGALELVPDKRKRAFFEDRGAVGQLCRDKALANGLILRATYDAMLLSPPLIISHAQVDELFQKTWKALNETAETLGM